jgi:hypothetical protein
MSVNEKSLFTIRDYLPSDFNFIMATWLRGLYYGDSWFKLIPKDAFMENYHKILDAIMGLPGLTIKVACLKEDIDVIIGYVVYKGQTLHWAFTKSAWRKIGIAKSLVPTNITTVTHLTKVGLSLLRKNPQIVFNPFALA